MNTQSSYHSGVVDPSKEHIGVYIKGIPGLRTLGIFGVIFYHMFPYDFKGGFLGVVLFFMVSGYLLAVKSEESRRVHTFSVGRFYLKRIERLYPQLIVVLLVTCGVVGIILPRILEGMKPELLSILAGYNNIWQIAQDLSYFERIASSSPFTHLWSLSFELQMYLIWPAIFFFFIFCTKKLGIKKAITIILIMAIATSVIMPALYRPNVDVTRIYYGTDTRIFSFLTGAYIGFKRVRYQRAKRIKSTRPYIALFFAILAAIIVGYVFMDGQAGFTYLGGMFIVNVGFAALLTLTVDDRLPIGDFLDKKVFRFFGDVSYEMYLWMYPVIYVFSITHLTAIPLSPVIMVAIIVLLSKWLYAFTRVLVKRKLPSFKNPFYKFVGVTALVGSIAFLAVAANGGYSIFAAGERDNNEFSEMSLAMEENLKLLAKQAEERDAVEAIEPVEPKADIEEPVEEPVDEPVEDILLEEEVKEGAEGTAGPNMTESNGSARQGLDTDTTRTGTNRTESGRPRTGRTDTTGSDSEDGPGVSGAVVAGAKGDRKITFVGDSVMLGAAPALLEKIPGCYVDAKESRQVSKTLQVIKDLDAQGHLGNVVVLGVGINSPFKTSVGQEIIDYLGKDREIYWINVYGQTVTWMDDSNRTIQEIVNNNKNVKLIDWAAVAPQHIGDWLYKDGIHLKPTGQQGYADFLAGIVQ